MHRHNSFPHRVNVAIVAPSLGILGGQAIQASRLIRAWEGDPDVSAWLVPIDPVPPGPFRYLRRVKYVRTIATQLTYWPRLVRELRRADVVHVFSASYASFLLAPLPAVTVARALGKPVLMNYRSGHAPEHLRRSGIARSTLRSVDLNIVPSTFLRDVFTTFDIQAEIIPNIVDLDRFAFRERAVLAPRVLSTRNFERHYNVACTLRTFERLQARYPDATLTLVGGGSCEARLRRLASDLKLRNVRFVGRVAPNDIWRYYADADLYLQTPDVDNMPTSVLEAFASGCPVVSTNAGGIPAIVTDGENGLLVPPDAADAASASLIRLLEDPNLASRLAARGRSACDSYHWSAVRSLWLSHYRGLTRPLAVPAPTAT